MQTFRPQHQPRPDEGLLSKSDSIIIFTLHISFYSSIHLFLKVQHFPSSWVPTVSQEHFAFLTSVSCNPCFYKKKRTKTLADRKGKNKSAAIAKADVGKVLQACSTCRWTMLVLLCVHSKRNSYGLRGLLRGTHPLTCWKSVLIYWLTSWFCVFFPFL